MVKKCHDSGIWTVRVAISIKSSLEKEGGLISEGNQAKPRCC